jgi:hypothetical protein
MATSAKSLIDHIEKYLGRIDVGWTRSPEGEKLGFQVVKCHGGQMEHARAFCTVGLSNFPFDPMFQTKLIRQELLILLPESCEDQNIPAVLQQLGRRASRRTEHQGSSSYWYMTPVGRGRTDLAGTTKSEYIFFFDGERVARRDGVTGTGGVFYYFSDHLQTRRSLPILEIHSQESCNLN